MWKYPELVDDIIPWVALLVAWHFTWEFVLDTKWARRSAGVIGKKVNHLIIWPLVFLVGGGVSVLYWVGINKSLMRLSAIAAQRHAALTNPERETAATNRTPMNRAAEAPAPPHLTLVYPPGEKPPPPPPAPTTKPVMIAPEKIAYRNVMTGYGSTYVFTIKSNSNFDLYSVVAKMSVESSAVQRDEYEVSVNEENRRVIYDENDGKISDPIILNITDHPSNFLGSWIIVYRLKPHETRDINVRLVVKGDSSINVSSSILSYESSPQALVADRGRVMLHFLDKWVAVWMEPRQPR